MITIKKIFLSVFEILTMKTQVYFKKNLVFASYLFLLLVITQCVDECFGKFEDDPGKQKF